MKLDKYQIEDRKIYKKLKKLSKDLGYNSLEEHLKILILKRRLENGNIINKRKTGKNY